MTSVDVAIVGGGSAAEMAAEHLAKGGKHVVVVESHLVGGECPFLACVPSKALLHAASAGMTWAEAVTFRDRTTQHRDDSGHEKALRDKGVEVLRGRATVTAPGELTVGDRAIAWQDLVVATGGAAATPDIDGIGDVEYWTSDEALTTTEQPKSLAILGGGPIGCELAQAFCRLGSEVTLLEVAEHLIPNEPEFVGNILTEALRRDGVEVLDGITIERVEAVKNGVALVLDDGDKITAERLLVATGKKPRTSGLGLEKLGIRVELDKPLDVDACGRLAPHVYAAGDVIGLAPYTHGANAQARTVARNILGGDESFDLRAIPRCVYTEPAVMCVGRTDGKEGVISAGNDLSTTARGAVDEAKAGRAEVFVDPSDGLVVGAALVGAHADAWGIELVLALQAAIPVRELTKLTHAFPTYGEVLEPIYTELTAKLGG